MNLTYDQTQTETKASRPTISHWFNLCRGVCFIANMNNETNTGGKIGGEGKVVEVDETKIGKRKFNRGRLTDGHWIFGMVERDSGKLRLEVCPDNKRDHQTLLSLINKHVEKNTTIMSNGWRGYSKLEEAGFKHFSVNHSKFFVDPVTGAHTQQIESSWRAMKRRLSRGGIKSTAYDLHFADICGSNQEKKITSLN